MKHHLARDRAGAVYCTMTGPLGDMLLRAEPAGEGARDVGAAMLTGVFFAGQKYFPALPPGPVPGFGAGRNEAGGGAGAEGSADAGAAIRLLTLARQQLREYFAGQRQAFTVPLGYRGSPFQQRVWQALAMLPFGETTSYGALGAALGLGGAHARAIGGAVGRNPLSVIVPCHRVLGVSGALTGYAGGVPRKVALLELERARPGGGWQ